MPLTARMSLRNSVRRPTASPNASSPSAICAALRPAATAPSMKGRLRRTAPLKVSSSAGIIGTAQARLLLALLAAGFGILLADLVRVQHLVARGDGDNVARFGIDTHHARVGFLPGLVVLDGVLVHVAFLSLRLLPWTGAVTAKSATFRVP